MTDAESGALLRQIPGDEALSMARILDRMQGMTGAELLQSTDQRTLERIFQEYGELPRTFAFVRALVERRSRASLQTTTDVKEVATLVYKHDASKYLPQIFQAVRIAVNDELGALEHLLSVAPTMLKAGGRLGIISFHSLEDRIVKQFINDEKNRDTLPSNFPIRSEELPKPRLNIVTKPIRPSDDEVKHNPRSRSGIMRVAERTAY